MLGAISALAARVVGDPEEQEAQAGSAQQRSAQKVGGRQTAGHRLHLASARLLRAVR